MRGIRDAAPLYINYALERWKAICAVYQALFVGICRGLNPVGVERRGGRGGKSRSGIRLSKNDSSGFKSVQ